MKIFTSIDCFAERRRCRSTEPLSEAMFLAYLSRLMRDSTRFTEFSNNLQRSSRSATEARVSCNRSRDRCRERSSCRSDSKKLVSSTTAVTPSFGQTSKWRCNLADSTSIDCSSRSLSWKFGPKYTPWNSDVNEWADIGAYFGFQTMHAYLTQLGCLCQPQGISINRRLLQADEDLLETPRGDAVQALEGYHPLVNLTQPL